VNPNIAGRNPGAECNWDGEGGVPPDVLTRKLQKLLMSRAAGIAGYPWESNTALGPGTRGQTEPLPLSRPQPPLRPQRSTTDPDNTMTVIDRKGAKEQESHSATRPGSSGRSQHQTPQMPPSLSPLLPFTNLQPSPVINDRPTSPASYPTQRQSSLRRGDQPGQSSSSLRSGSSRHNSNATSSSHGHTRLPPVPAPLPSTARVTDVARSNTSATQRSVSWRQRSRALSTAASTHRPVADENTHVRSTTEPVPPRDRTALLVNAFVGALNGKRLVLEIHPETTARDVLLAAHQLGDLTDLTGGISWVVVEIFAELGCGKHLFTQNVRA